MSSFLTDPSARKRKRAGASDAPKKRLATAGSGRTGGSTKYAATSSKKNIRQKTSSGPASGKKAKSGKASASSSSRRADDADNNNHDDDESISGSDSDDGHGGRGGDNSDNGSGFFSDEEDDNSDLEGEDGEELTAAERRLRIAERYLKNIKQELGGDDADADEDDDVDAVERKETYMFDAKDVDRDLIAERLREDVAESKGRVYRKLANELQLAEASHCLVRWNAQNVNAVAVCAPYAYTVSSDAYLTKWRIQDTPAQQQAQRQAKWDALHKDKKKKKKKKSAGTGTAAGTKDVPAKKQPERVLYRRGDLRRRRDRTYQGHVGAILCVAASQDGRFVATGGADRRLVVWDAATLKVLRVFTKHRDAVTGLVFRRGTNQLYSCSADRSVIIWSLNELAFVQSLFGHQNKVVAIDALAPEKCLSVGSRDRTARLWKVVEETQLVFRGGLNVARLVGEHRLKKKGAAATEGEQQEEADGGERPPPRGSKKPLDSGSLAHEGSMDCVAMLDDELFVTGSDNGALALWSTQKKKPLWVVPRAHGLAPGITGREDYDQAFADPAVASANPPPPPQPRWITALRTIPYSDVVLSGSSDGCVRVWRLSEDKRKLEALGVLGQEEAIDDDEEDGDDEENERSEDKDQARIRGVVNGIAVFERGDRGKDGLSIVVAVGREHRLGRWGGTTGARNGAVVFEVPRQSVVAQKAPVNGVNGLKLLANGVSSKAKKTTD